MQHEDGDEEDLDEAEVQQAIGLAETMSKLPFPRITVDDRVQVRWAGDGKWYPATVAHVTKDVITVHYPASGTEPATQDELTRRNCSEGNLRLHA